MKLMNADIWRTRHILAGLLTLTFAGCIADEGPDVASTEQGLSGDAF